MEVRIENIPIDELSPHPDNLRIYGENPYVWNLVTSIKEHGLLRPIVIDQDKRIIDGVRRWTASMNLELETVPCETREFEDKDSAISAILNYNIYRHKTPRQIFNESREVKRIETERARKRQEATRFGSEKGDAEVGGAEGNVRDIVASFFKMGRSKFKELETVFESEDVYSGDSGESG